MSDKDITCDVEKALEVVKALGKLTSSHKEAYGILAISIVLVATSENIDVTSIGKTIGRLLTSKQAANLQKSLIDIIENKESKNEPKNRFHLVRQT